MREIKISNDGEQVTIAVGVVDASGKYEVLELTQAEAAVLMMKLQSTL